MIAALRPRCQPCSRRFGAIAWIAVAMLLFGSAGTTRAAADELSDAAELQTRQDWLACLPLAEAAVKARPWNERAWHALLESQWRTGDALAAAETVEEALRRFPSSIRLRLSGRDALRMCGAAEEAAAVIDPIDEMVRQAPWRYTDAGNRVLLGEYYLGQGADARQVLEVFFDKAKQAAPRSAGPFVAAGRLALAKGDFKMAGDEFQQALKREPENPQAKLGLAQAFVESDTNKALSLLAEVLEQQPRHIPAMLMLAERQIDGELYEDARETVDKALAVNPDHPLAWSLLSVIAALEGDQRRASLMRRIALGWWSENPAVDHLIGRKLSQHYRFAEGAELQRNVLKLDPQHVAASLQLSQDLLRLGREEEGWRLAERSLELDGYSVLAHNLVRLRKQLDQFTTLEDGDFIVRMDATEAQVYGRQVLALLQQAQRTLCEKYGHALQTPVIVEIFPQQADFAIRTFGVPGGEGFLGVCFGSVITANSPASQGGSPANWAAVLWHEFCHVVTLQKTRNRMPRWLSEGLSVYEERERRAGWGQDMTPEYRRMILGGELTPVSELSSAFLKPPSPLHLQFAYFESSLVVQYLIDTYGMAPMIRVLDELGDGLPINDALARTAGSIEALDQAFEQYARQRALALAPKADWAEAPAAAADDPAALQRWLDEHPDSLPGMQRRVKQLMEQGQWADAVRLLETLVEWLPDEGGPGCPREVLAKVHRELGDRQREVEVLRELLIRDGDHEAAGIRLLELATEQEDWATAQWAGRRLCEINPLRAATQRQLGRASVAAGDHLTAIEAHRATLALGPVDPAGTHFQLAESLYAERQWDRSKRQVLMALEEAPRYQAAQQLLLRIVDRPPDPPAGGDENGRRLPPWETLPLLPPLESMPEPPT